MAASTKRSRGSSGAKAQKRPPPSSARRAAPTGLSSLVEQAVDRIIRPLGLVVLSRERIQETLDEAAERGRVTRTDANELASLLIQRGRQQTDELLGDIEGMLGRSRQQLDSAASRATRTRSVDRIVRGADRARRTVKAGPSFPILRYDELTAVQIKQRLSDLSPADLRKVRQHERRHGNRKSVLTSIDKRLG
jgi:polyhydroxyalkanoate synthesis regulator phasin